MHLQRGLAISKVITQSARFSLLRAERKVNFRVGQVQIIRLHASDIGCVDLMLALHFRAKHTSWPTGYVLERKATLALNSRAVRSRGDRCLLAPFRSVRGLQTLSRCLEENITSSYNDGDCIAE